MADNDAVSHGDIYHKLGTMEGKIESVLLQLAEKRGDVNSLFGRVREIENKVAWGMGAAAIMSIVIPLLVSALSPRIHLGPQEPVHTEQPR